MVKHIAMWNFNPEMSAEEKQAAGKTCNRSCLDYEE